MKVYSLNIIKDKGLIKRNCSNINLIKNHGIESDYYSGKDDYQVSFFSIEAKDKNNSDEVGYCFSRFVENICTIGVDISKIKIGSTLKIGTSVMIVTKISRECNKSCPVKKFALDSCKTNIHIMFAKVIAGGTIYPGDKIEIIEQLH